MDTSGITDAKIEELVKTIFRISEELDGLNEKLITRKLAAVDKIKDYLTQLDRVKLNIAVTGESGSGKSTFINAFRGLGDEEEGSAETGVVETTTEPTAYPYPKFPNVKLWDLPGIGTPTFKADEYLKQVDFERYDFFIILASDRFRECHANLAAEILNMNKKFYFVRSKIDNNIEAEKRRKTFNKEKTLDVIRENCLKGLKKIGLTSPAVFLISCFDLNNYDFNCLVETMETELSQAKRDLLTLAVPNISLEINKRKKKALQYDIWRIALVSAYTPVVTISVLNATTTISVDVDILVTAIKKYCHALSWDPDSLNKLSEIAGKPVHDLEELVKTIFRISEELDGLNEKLITRKLAAVDKIKDYLTQLDRVKLNIAVTGESGSGKSTFINAFRGLGDEEEGSAETGVVETTTEPTVYPHPKFPNVKLWDLPGIGTPTFKADEYLKQVDFERYDFFIILASDRFRECHAILAAEILNMHKKFYFVRSKIDNNVEAEKRKKTFNEENMLDVIRKNCIKGLEEIGLKSPAVFLISCFKLGLYDFNCLEETLERELPQHKRDVLMLALPNITLEINRRKKKALQGNIWKLALISAAVAAVPIPGLNAAASVSADVSILVSELRKYYKAFGLDPNSLQKLSDSSGKSVDDLKAVLKSPLNTEITKDLVIRLLTSSSLFAIESAAEYFLGFIPILGSLAAGSLSFATIYYLLQRCLNELAEDARNVLMAALQTEV